MAAGKGYHWKHGWIPVSPEAKAYVAGRGPKPTGKRDHLGEILSRFDFGAGGSAYTNPTSSLPTPKQADSQRGVKPQPSYVGRFAKRVGNSMVSPLPPPPPLANRSSDSPEQIVDRIGKKYGKGSRMHKLAQKRYGVKPESPIPKLQSGGMAEAMALGKGNRSLPQLGAMNKDTDPSRKLSRDDFFFGHARGGRNFQIPLRADTLNISQREMRQGTSIAQSSEGLTKSLHDDGGFTFDVRNGGVVEVGSVQGVAVAVPGTETSIPADGGPQAVKAAMISMIGRYQKDIANGAMIGGWYSKERDEYVVELTQLVPDRDTAVRLGQKRNQEGVFDMETGEYIPTGGTGDALRLANRSSGVEGNALNQSDEMMLKRAAVMYGTDSKAYRAAVRNVQIRKVRRRGR